MSEESSSIPFEKREGENPERFIPDGMNAIERNVKRIGDCLLAFIALIVFSPLFLICYIVVRCEDGGPAVFKQERIGRFGRPFHIYKFRSMRLDAEKFGPALYKGGADPRLSAINAENQQIIKQTPNFTPKNVKLGVFILFKTNHIRSENNLIKNRTNEKNNQFIFRKISYLCSK